MKRLLILRHAKSDWGNPALPDHERTLNKRGRQDAPRMGRLLEAEGLVPDRILCSTAVRARTTADLVAEACGFGSEVELEQDFYLGETGDYTGTLAALGDDSALVLVVGHNPGLEELVEELTGAREVMPTAGLACVRFDFTDWAKMAGPVRGELVKLWRPKEL